MSKNFLGLLLAISFLPVVASACSSAKYTCSSDDNDTSLCINSDNKVLVDLALANGGDFSEIYNIQGIAQIGDITTYDYTELKLQLLFGTGETDGKVPAYLTYGSAGFTNFPMKCIQSTSSGN
jgi:hypothetical protein